MTEQPRVLLTVEAAAERLSISRTTMFTLIKAGAIESVKVGRLRRIPAEAITAYINDLDAVRRPSAANPLPEKEYHHASPQTS